ncbi:four-carbon acid sugar kinase family protein [Alcaligenaceae bacterium CGII-47]|nr:four-carbon acid sugar kinase family protein [Alcaligenaceae bacterium CGII-47]
MRGNIGAEVAAAVEVAGMAIVAPAFPTMGRTTVNGHQLLNGVALQHTEVWRHEGLQGTSDLVGIMRGQNLNTLAVGLSDIRGPVDLFRSLFINSARQGKQVLVCDAERDDDLARIAQASWQLPFPCFWAGSAGLVGQLAAAISSGPSIESRPVPSVAGRCLVVVGSMSGISGAQVDQLRRKRAMPLLSVSADALMGAEAHAGWLHSQEALAAALSRGDAMLAVSCVTQLDRTVGPALSKALGRLVATQASQIGAIVATGGETARAVLHALGVSRLDLAAEVEPGVPISVASGTRTLPVITKAGAFGTAMTLVRCYDALRR